MEKEAFPSWFVDESGIKVDRNEEKFLVYSKLPLTDLEADQIQIKSWVNDGDEEKATEFKKRLLEKEKESIVNFSEDLSSFFNLDVPSDLVKIERAEVFEREAANYSLMKLSIALKDLRSNVTEFSKMQDEARKTCQKYYNDALNYYDEYKDSFAISLLLKAAVLSYKSGLLRYEESFPFYLDLARVMLSRIAINFNFEDSYLDGSLRVVRTSNILKEGISLAEVNKEILDSDSSVIYSLSTVTNEMGTGWIYNDYFTNADSIQLRYSLKLYDCDKELLFLRQNNLIDSNELKENFLKLFDSFTYYYTAENIKTQKLEADEYPNIVILSCISNFYSNINFDVNDEGLVEY